MEVSPFPIQLTLDEIKASYFIKSLTPQEQEGITENRTLEGVQLTLPPRFHWVPVEQAVSGYYRHAFLASEANGPKRIHLVFNKQEIVEVNILNL